MSEQLRQISKQTTELPDEEKLRGQLIRNGGVEKYVEEGRAPLFVDLGVGKPTAVWCILPPEGVQPGDQVRVIPLVGVWRFVSPDGKTVRGEGEIVEFTPIIATGLQSRVDVALRRRSRLSSQR